MVYNPWLTGSTDEKKMPWTMEPKSNKIYPDMKRNADPENILGSSFTLISPDCLRNGSLTSITHRDSNTTISSGDRKSVRWARKKRRKLMICGGCLACFIVFNAVMLTVGVQLIAEYMLNNYYPAQFNLTRYPFTKVRMGPMAQQQSSGGADSIRVSFRVPVPAGLPVSVSLDGPIAIDLLICPPPVISAGNISRDLSVAVAVETNCPKAQELSIGRAVIVDQSTIDIPASGPGSEAEMNLELFVDDKSLGFHHLVHALLSSGQDLTATDGSNQSSRQDSNGYEKQLVLDGGFDYDSIDQTIIRVKMTLPCIRVFFLCIRNLAVDKTVLLQDKNLNYNNQGGYNISTVGGLFAIISRALVGDLDMLQYTSRYLHVDNLQLYDANYGYPLPLALKALSSAEFQFFASRPTSAADPAMTSNSSTTNQQAPVYAGIGRPKPNNNIRVTKNNFNQGDPDSLPFSIDICFNNPTAVELIGIRNICINLNYSGQSIANITIPSVDIRPFANSSFRAFGYLHSTEPRSVLTTDLVNSLLAVMVSQNFTNLPFSLTGCNLNSLPGPATNSQNIYSAIQTLLSRRVVNVGNIYSRFGPLTDPNNNKSLAINQVFSRIPVFGAGRLGDILQGIQLHMGFGVVAGRIPVSVYLANPFNCSIAIDSFTINVYLNDILDASVGRVTVTKPIFLAPNQKSGMYPNGTMIAAAPQIVFVVDLAIIRRLSSTLAYLTASDPNNPRPFSVSLEFVDIMVRVGRMNLPAYKISQYSLRQIPLISAAVMNKVGGMNGMMGLFTAGYNMIAPDTSPYHSAVYNSTTTDTAGV